MTYGVEGATNPGPDLYVVNNTFLNDSSAGGTYVLSGGGVFTPALLQSNLIAGIGVLTNQTSALDTTNYRSGAPALVERANYELHPAPGALFINAGSASGVSLAPTLQYKHVARTKRVRPMRQSI